MGMQLHHQLLKTIDQFAKEHPKCPTEIIASIFGDALILFSMEHVGKAQTLDLMTGLVDVIARLE